MEIFLGRPFEVYIAELWAKPILFTKVMVVAYVRKALENNVNLLREEPSSKHQQENGSGTKYSCITTKSLRKNA